MLDKRLPNIGGCGRCMLKCWLPLILRSIKGRLKAVSFPLRPKAPAPAPAASPIPEGAVVTATWPGWYVPRGWLPATLTFCAGVLAGTEVELGDVVMAT